MSGPAVVRDRPQLVAVVALLPCDSIRAARAEAPGAFATSYAIRAVMTRAPAPLSPHGSGMQRRAMSGKTKLHRDARPRAGPNLDQFCATLRACESPLCS